MFDNGKVNETAGAAVINLDDIGVRLTRITTAQQLQQSHIVAHQSLTRTPVGARFSFVPLIDGEFEVGRHKRLFRNRASRTMCHANDQSVPFVDGITFA